MEINNAMATPIKFGTDGWRAVIAKEYTVDNVRRIAAATGLFMQQRNMTTAVLGFDCRFGGPLFAETTAEVLVDHGIEVLMDPEFVSTPMISLGVRELSADMGIVITASHNPPSYNGYKLKSGYGGPTIPKDIQAVEDLIPEHYGRPKLTFAQALEKGRIKTVDLEQLYINHIEKHFDLDTIRNANIGLAYDAMFGAGQNVIRRLFPNAHLLHCEHNPSFHGQAPEPIHRNLSELADLMSKHDHLDLGLANDGDADRIGLYNDRGEFVDSHHILLLLLQYMAEYKKQEGKVVVTFSVTNKMKQLADHYGRDFEVTPVGFKYIAEIMTKETVVVGGEESGGLAVQSHLPERDGIWVGLLVMEFMAKTGKSLRELIEDIYKKVGRFAYDRDDLAVSDAQKAAVIHRCQTDPFTHFGPYELIAHENMDGFKFIIDDDTWAMIRPSGTEPVLRVYAQAKDAAEVRSLLDAINSEIDGLDSQ